MKKIWQDIKNGELKLFCITILIAAFSISTVVFFTAGMRSTLTQEASTLLGGDQVLQSPTPIIPIFLEKANQFHLNISNMIVFFSMLVHQDQLALSEVKAVDAQYPLKGMLQAQQPISTIPEEGTLWLEASLLSLLKINLNDTVTLGDATFRVAKILTFEPDRGGQGFSLAPRALMNLKDVEKTHVLQAGSRQTYYLLMTGSEKNLQSWNKEIQFKLDPRQILKTAEKEKSRIGNLFEQIEYYLSWVIGANILFGAVAISQTVHRFCLRQYRSVAILRCFGASFQWILNRYILEISFLGILSSLIGYGLGFLFFFYIRQAVKVPLGFNIRAIWSTPLLYSLGTIVILLLLFGLPPILKLRNISPLWVLKKKVNVNKVGVRKIDFPILQKLFSKLGVAFKYGATNLFRYPKQSLWQIFSFTLILISIYTLVLIHYDLIKSFQPRLSKNAPNFFVINLETQGVSKFQELLKKFEISHQTLYPVVRARLLKVNDQEVSMEETNEQDSNQRRIPRLLNISYVSDLPPENEITDGHWFTQENIEKPLVSLEQEFAKRMAIKIGDELTFQMAEKTISAKVSSLRSVHWDSFYPNFFVLFPLKILDAFPKTFMTSFYVPLDKKYFLKTLIEQFPSISLIDISMVLKQVELLIDMLSIGILYLLLFTLLMVIMMLFCILNAHMDERKRDALLFRILGVSRKKLVMIFLTEFTIIGLISGILASIGAYGFYYRLVKDILTLPSFIHWEWILLGPLVSIIFLNLLGWLNLHKILSVSPKALVFNRYS